MRDAEIMAIAMQQAQTVTDTMADHLITALKPLVHLSRAEARTALTTYLQAMQPVPVVTVKPLEWQDGLLNGKSHYTNTVAQTPIGDYVIEWKSWKEYDSPSVALNGSFLFSAFDVEDAKVKAQADYEQRIRSALTATANAEPGAVPDGWKLVPIKPTNEMVSAVRDIAGAQAAAYGLAAWDTMLKAAPVSGGDNAK